jgi:drug/metabolite transporter (DMT)-like permease
LTDPTKGVACALLAPLAWAVAVILFKRSDRATPASLNLFKNAFGFVLLSITLAAWGIGLPADRPVSDWLRLAVSGLLGLAIADTLLFAALARIDAARLAVVDTLYAPTVVLLSVILLGERPTQYFAIGASAVVAGIAIATIRIGSPSARGRLWTGMLFGAGAIAGTALGVVIAKPVLERSDLLEVTWTRLCVGLIGQVAWIAARGQLAEARGAFVPSALWRTLVPAAFMGTYVSLILWLGGYKWADASVAAVLNQLATVYVLILARAVLGETLRPAQVAGTLLAAAGAVWVVLLS